MSKSNRRDFLKKLTLGSSALAGMTAFPALAFAAKQSEQRVAMGVFDRYVTKHGNDNNDGLSWQTAKLTVNGAVSSLPDEASGVEQRKHGDVFIANGKYIEDDTIEMSSNIRFHGSGVPNDPTAVNGTIIKLADGVNKHLFGPRATFKDYAHAVILSNLLLDGNRDNQTETDIDILHFEKPGFNTSVQNVHFHNAKRTAIYVNEVAINLHGFNVTGASCGGFLFVNSVANANLGMISFYGVQIDDCGPYPFEIESLSNGVNQLAIHGLESEASLAGEHQAIIRYIPKGGANGWYFTLDAFACWRAVENIGSGQAVLLIENGTGGWPHGSYRSLIQDNYDHVYRNRQNGATNSERTWFTF